MHAEGPIVGEEEPLAGVSGAQGAGCPGGAPKEGRSHSSGISQD